MEDKTVKEIVVIVCIAGLEALAMLLGIDGAMLALAIGALAGLAGYELKAIRVSRQQD